MKPTQKTYTVAEAAALLELTTGRIRQLCRWNSIGTKHGRDWLLTAKNIEELRNR